jgi:hypothetical protein
MMLGWSRLAREWFGQVISVRPVLSSQCCLELSYFFILRPICPCRSAAGKFRDRGARRIALTIPQIDGQPESAEAASDGPRVGFRFRG